MPGIKGRSGAPGQPRQPGGGRKIAKRTLRIGSAFAVTQEIDGGSLTIQQWRVVELDRTRIVIESDDGSVIRLVS